MSVNVANRDRTARGDLSIGRLAELSGLPVKTIRFYSDEGLLPPAGRTDAGHRRYGAGDLARLQLIRSLREFEVDLPSIRRVLEGHEAMGDVLGAHIAALEQRVAGLHRQLAVLRAAATSPPETTVRRLQALTRLDAADRRRLLEHFWDRVTDGLPEAGRDRLRPAGIPDLPLEPTSEQLDAWLELAQLVSDEDFIATTQANTAWLWDSVGQGAHLAPAIQAAGVARADARALAADGVSPEDPRADPIVARLVAGFAALLGRNDDQSFRSGLVDQVDARTDPRAARFWELVTIVDPSRAPADGADPELAYTWLIAALRYRR
jgi:DNA-binding transcriptional MerR regulator